LSWSWLDPPAEGLLVEVAKDVHGLGQASQGGQRLGNPIGRAGVGEALDDDVRRGEPILERGGDPDEPVPLLDDDGDVDRAAQQRVEPAVIGAAIDAVKHLVGKILEPGHEVDTEQDAQAPQRFGKSARIGRVLANPQDGVVLENAVENVVRLTWGTRNPDHPIHASAMMMVR
jgi:hypothetical protein